MGTRIALAVLLALASLPLGALPTPGWLGTPAVAAAVTTFPVNSTGDSDDGACDAHCTLREAINAANSNNNPADRDEITFEGSCTSSSCTISVSSALPNISQKVRINGPTSGTQPRVTLSGVGNVGSAGLKIISTGAGSEIRGLAINNFNGFAGVAIEGPSTTGSIIAGNRIGTDAAGTTGFSNNFGITIVNGASGNIIGGSTAADRNVIAGNTFDAVQIQGSNGNTVKGNYIGVDAQGNVAVPATGGASNTGISITDSSSNTIGGTSTSDRNVIAGVKSPVLIVGVSGAGATSNTVRSNRIGTNAAGTAAVRASSGASNGVEIKKLSAPSSGNTVQDNLISGAGTNGILVSGDSARNNIIRGNSIGVDANGGALGNLANGILITQSANGNLIGGTGAGEGNTIANNGQAPPLPTGDGVRIAASAFSNSVRNNTVTGNTGVGIDVVSTGTGNTCSGNTVTGNAGGNIVNCTDSGSTPPGEPSAATSTVVPVPNSVGAGEPSTVTVTVKDQNQTALENVSVTLSATRGGNPSTVDSITGSPGTTDAFGVAIFSVTSTVLGTATLTAVAGTVPLTPATVTFTTGEVSATLSTVSASPGTRPADGASPSVITVTLRDAGNNPISGTAVSLASSRGATDAIGPPSGNSNASGVVTFSASSSTPGSPVFTATAGGVVINQTASVAFFSSGSRTLSFLKQPARASAGFPFGVNLQVQDDVGAFTEDNSTRVTLQLMPPAGAEAATLTCSGDEDAAAGVQRTMLAGVALFAGCIVNLRAEGYRLQATAEHLNLVASAEFNVRMGGDADNTCITNPTATNAVDIVDFSLLLKGFGRRAGIDGPAFDPNVDFDGSDSTDIVDFSILLGRFGQPCG